MKLTQRVTKATARGVIAVAGLALLLGAPAAMANPITAFSYTSNVGFYNWTQTHTTGSTADDIFADNPNGGVVSSSDGSPYTRLAWGDPSDTNQSSLELNPANFGGPSSSVAPNSGIAAPSGSVTHNNYVITGDHLTAATIEGVFTLTAVAPPGGTLSQTVPFSISFDETDNAGPCAGGSSTPCRDIFVLNNPDILTLGFSGGIFGAQFADYNYVLTLGTLDSLGNFLELPTLDDTECLAAGVAAGCRGFTTDENQSTTVNLGFTIGSFKAVPEPTPIALFGLGLLMLGVMLRRRRRTDHAD